MAWSAADATCAIEVGGSRRTGDQVCVCFGLLGLESSQSCVCRQQKGRGVCCVGHVLSGSHRDYRGSNRGGSAVCHVCCRSSWSSWSYRSRGSRGSRWCRWRCVSWNHHWTADLTSRIEIGTRQTALDRNIIIPSRTGHTNIGRRDIRLPNRTSLPILKCPDHISRSHSSWRRIPQSPIGPSRKIALLNGNRCSRSNRPSLIDDPLHTSQDSTHLSRGLLVGMQRVAERRDAVHIGQLCLHAPDGRGEIGCLLRGHLLAVVVAVVQGDLCTLVHSEELASGRGNGLLHGGDSLLLVVGVQGGHYQVEGGVQLGEIVDCCGDLTLQGDGRDCEVEVSLVQTHAIGQPCDG